MMAQRQEGDDRRGALSPPDQVLTEMKARKN